MAAAIVSQPEHHYIPEGSGMPVLTAIRKQCFTLLGAAILLYQPIPAYAAIECFQCHGSSSPPDYRPVDAAYRNITSGGFRGNHRTHMGPGATATACAACHPSTGYTSSHRNERIDLAANINSSPLTAVYRNGSSGFPQTPTPRLSSCSNVNCHFERETPVWGGASLTVPDGCGACHGAPPAGGESGPAGSHLRHAAVYNGLSGCSVCHNDHLAETNSFAHATSAGRRPLNIRLAGGGSYDGPLNDVLPRSQENRFGSCSNVSCHEDGTYAGTGTYRYAMPAWGGDPCTACHANPPAYTSGAPKANSHPQHRNSCDTCHYGTTTDGTTLAAASNHRNGAYDISARDGSVVYNPADKRCSTAYCHTNGTSIATGAPFANLTTPPWGSSGTLGCGSCHGNPPAYANGSPKSNAHPKHDFYGYSCSRCHYATTMDGITISSYSSTHGNRRYDVSSPGNDAIQYRYSSTGSSCSATYCHSTAQGTSDPTQPPTYRTVSWGQQFGEGCHACHYAGDHSDIFIPYMASGSHGRHLRYDGGKWCNSCHYSPFYEGKMCDQCHVDFYTHSDTSARGPEHVNGVIDVVINPNVPVPGATGSYSGDPAPGTPYGNCSNLYCHSQGTRQSPPFALPNVTELSWGGPSLPADCTGCHGGDAQSSIPLVTGSHGQHGIYGCVVCHSTTVTGNRTAIPVDTMGGGANIFTDAAHIANGYVEVVPPGDPYGPQTGYGRLPGSEPLRCTNTYCHSSGVKVTTGVLFGNNSSPVWGRSGSCSSCHGYPPSYEDTVPKANGHPLHAANPCSSCHYGVTRDGTTIADRSLHPNSGYEVDPGPGVGFLYSYSKLGGTCSMVSCHQGGSLPRIWTSTSCGTCHGAPPQDNAHKRHFTGLPRMAVYGSISTTARYQNNCGHCHPVDPARDNDGTVQVELYNPALPAASAKGRSTAAAYAGGSCADIYCHSSGTAVATGQTPSSPAVAWNAPPLSCGSCHGNPPAYASGTPKANSHGRHDAYSCGICHAATTTDGTSIADRGRHGNAGYDLSPGINTTFSYTFAQTGGSCSANSCHSDGTWSRQRVRELRGTLDAAWGGESLSCSSCHGNPPQYASSRELPNSHPLHAKYPCGSCHYKVSGEGSGIADRALHANGNCELDPSSGVNFTTHWVVTSYYWNTVSIECDNVSCHNDGTAVVTGSRVPGQASATWGSGLGCTGCHANPPAYANGSPKANSHGRHAGYGCQSCHYSVTTSGTNIADRNLHANDSYEVTPSPGNMFGYTFAASGGSCANVSCHNDGTGVATGSQQIAPPAAWGDTFACGSCHGNPPSYASNSPKKNSHLGAHTGIGCQLCHAAVTTTGTTITAPALHGNSQYNVTPGTGTGFSYTYAASGGSCATIHCHSDGTVIRTGTIRSNGAAWGGNSLGCDGCHGNPPAYTANSPKGNAHLFSGHSALGCQACHYPVTGNGVSITDPARHKNGAYDVGPAPSSSFSYTFSPTSYSVCGNVTCHSDGTAVATGIPQSTASSFWYTGTNCLNFCHAIPPQYANGTPKKNSHGKHQYYRCMECHYDTVSSTNDWVVSNPANHKNGAYTLKQGPGRSFTYSFSSGGGTCTLVSCHGDGTSIATGTLASPTPAQWGVTALGCDGCHGYPPLYPSGSPKKNSHAKHSGLGCQLCHSSTTWDGTYVSPSYHINGQYTLSGTKIGTYTYSASGSTCSLVQCHSDGTYVSTGSLGSRLGTTTWGTPLTLACTSCHGMPPAYANGYPKGNSHGVHAGRAIGCVSCHAGVTADGATILNRSKHGNGQYDVSFSDSTTSFTYTYRSGGSSCSDVACHPPEKRNINWSAFAQAPTVFSPVNNENYAQVNEPVKVYFTEEMDPASITAEGVFTLSCGTTPVSGTVSYDPATNIASFTPDVPLDYLNPYTARLTNAVRNLAGQQLQNSYTWSFTTTNSPNFTYFVNSTFDLMSMGNLDIQSPSGGGSWTVITPGFNGASLSGMNQGYARMDEATKIDAQMRTFQLDLTNYQSLKLSFLYNFRMSPPSVADVEISLNGAAGPWTSIRRWSATYANYSYQGSETVNLSAVAKGEPNIVIRFRFTPQTPSNSGWWAVDNLYVGGDPR